MAGFDHSGGSGTKEVTVVEVRNPLIHEDSLIITTKAFTDYEICIKTTSKAFIIPQSYVRRRYSDFVWLRNWLIKQNDAFSRTEMPKLPPKKIVGNNDPEFVQKRMHGLQKFMRKVIEHNVFLSDKALHLFLQSGMNVKEIEHYLTVGTNSRKEEASKSDETLVNHFESERIRSQSALQSITEISPRGDNTEEDEKKYSSSYSSSFSSVGSSLLDSFEAITVDDCPSEPLTADFEEKSDAVIDSSGKSSAAENKHDSDTQSQSSLTGFGEEDLLSIKALRDSNNKSQTSSNNSLAECDRDS